MELADQIALLRKKSGLSQEELGEKIGVSRQAVSKWESGKAVPELENLKELSRIFGVSLSELLQLEENAQGEKPAFSCEETENKVTQMAPPTNRKRYIVLGSILAGCILALTATIIYTQMQIQGLNQQLSSIQSDLGNVRAEWSMTIGSLRTEIEEILEKQGSAISEYHFDVLSFQPIGKKIQVKFFVTPKHYTENTRMILTFSGSDFEPILLEDIDQTGGIFSGTVSLPTSHEIRVSATFLENGESLSESLDSIYGFDDYLLTVTSTFQGDMSQYALIDESRGTLSINGSLVVNTQMNNGYRYPALANYPDSGVVQLYKDGKVFRKYDIDFYENHPKPNYDQGSSAVTDYYDSIAVAVPMKESFKTGEWQQISIEITVVDRFGIQYKQTTHSFGDGQSSPINETEILYPTK